MNEREIHEAIVAAEDRVVERVLGIFLSVLREVENTGGPRDGTFERLLSKELRENLEYERTRRV